MRVTERLRNLDRRAETIGKRFQRQYDTEPPAWIKHGWLLTLLGPLTLPLTIATSRVTSIAVVTRVRSLLPRSLPMDLKASGVNATDAPQRPLVRTQRSGW